MIDKYRYIIKIPALTYENITIQKRKSTIKIRKNHRLKRRLMLLYDLLAIYKLKVLI